MPDITDPRIGTAIKQLGDKLTPGTDLLGALLAVQAEAPTLPKDATNPHFESKYTPLDTIVEKVGPILNKHGLVWMTFPTSDNEGRPALKYQLVHAASGEMMSGTMPLLLTKVDSQGMGSAITYARRYSLCAVLNLVADDDDDGNTASRPASPGRVTNPDAEPTGPQLKKLRSLVTKHKPPEQTLRAMLDRVGASNIDVKPGWAGRLTRAQASGLIDIFVGGVLPDPGAQDIPSDDAPELPLVGDESDLPWDAAVAGEGDERDD